MSKIQFRSKREQESQPVPSKQRAKEYKGNYKDQHGRSSLWCLEVFIAFHALYALVEFPVSTRECA